MKNRIPARILTTVFILVVLVLGFGFRIHAQNDENPATDIQEKILSGMEHKLQRKDTKLLCLDGCASDRDQREEMKDRRWDYMQPGHSLTDEHGIGNCARASIAMMVYYYGKCLSQDRIAYYMEVERNNAGDDSPEGDLAHQKGMNYSPDYGGEETIAMKWALNENITFRHGSPTFSQLKEWLDENRPIMIRRINYAGMSGRLHICVIDGYRVTYKNGNKKEEVHILDPMIKPCKDFYKAWREYPIPNRITGGTETIEGIWVGPDSAPNARQDEASIWKDSDSDGIMDFDEEKRFFTNPFDKDTDHDGVDDKSEIRQLIFDAQNSYIKKSTN
jgi:hypothetical protein